MYRKPSKKQLLIQRLIVFVIMTVSIVVIVAGTILFILGYRLDGTNGRFEQNALVQFDSRPNGAAISIDGVPTGAETAAKRSIVAGEHTFEVTKSGYRSWQRTIDLQPGTLTWLDYVRLVPEKLDKRTVRSYTEVVGVKAAPDMQTIVVQQQADQPSFDVVDIRDQEVKSEVVRLPQEAISEATAEGVTHRYEMQRFDEGGRYLLVRHYFKDTSEWIVFDTENAEASVNVSRLLSIELSDLQFAGTNGNILYGLTEGVVRKLDLGSATISRGLVTHVQSFEMYETSLFSYVGRDPENNDVQVVGVYRDGDREPHVLRTVEDTSVPLFIDTARYFNNDYVVIAEGLEITVLKGRYPTSSDSDTRSLSEVERFTAPSAVNQVSFSPEGDFVLVRSGLTLMSYEVEHDRLHQTVIQTSDTKSQSVSWADKAHLIASYDGHLSMRDFDGTNVQVIMPIVAGFDATLSQNGRYFYGVNKQDETYRLERVTMILE